MNILDIVPHFRLYNPHSYEEWICVHLYVKSTEQEPILETRLQLKMETYSNESTNQMQQLITGLLLVV